MSTNKLFSNFFIFPKLLHPRPLVISKCFQVLILLVIITTKAFNYKYISFIPILFFTVLFFYEVIPLIKVISNGKRHINHKLMNRLYRMPYKSDDKITIEYKDMLFKYHLVIFDTDGYSAKRTRDLTYLFEVKTKFHFIIIKFAVYFYLVFGIYIYPIVLSCVYFILRLYTFDKLYLLIILTGISIFHIIIMCLLDLIFKLEYYFPFKERNLR